MTTISNYFFTLFIRYENDSNFARILSIYRNVIPFTDEGHQLSTVPSSLPTWNDGYAMAVGSTPDKRCESSPVTSGSTKRDVTSWSDSATPKVTGTTTGAIYTFVREHLEGGRSWRITSDRLSLYNICTTQNKETCQNCIYNIV